MALFSLDEHSRFVSQAPMPIVEIVDFDPITGEDWVNKIVLAPEIDSFKLFPKEMQILQSYSFKYSTNDVDGSFSLILHPDGMEKIPVFSNKPIFDRIKPLQIVYIYEHDKNKKKPDFVGIVNRKRFVAQSGGSLRISVTGKSVASLISRFKISLDINAMSLSKQKVTQDEINKKLTSTLEKAPRDLSLVLDTVWSFLLKMSKDYLDLATSDLEKYIDEYLGGDFFEIEDGLKFQYPLASVLNGQNTMNFWDIANGIIPPPVYEKFAYINEDGETKIKIRESPFDCSADGSGHSSWDDLEKDKKELTPELVKDFDFEVSDDEVYTAFYTYIVGSPVSSDFAFRKSTQSSGYGDNSICVFGKKAQIYGYNPLLVSFNGYGKPEKEYSENDENELAELNKRMKNWYGHLDEMLRGTITLATELKKPMPMCGEIVSFLGGEFYVDAVEHSWSYGGAPETKLTVSRGGDYSGKKFKPLENVTKRYQIFKKKFEESKESDYKNCG